MTPGESTDSGRVAALADVIGTRTEHGTIWVADPKARTIIAVLILASDWLADVVAQAKAEALAPFDALFSGGPDTVCRTQWREAGGGWPDEECVVVPMADLQDAFRAAREATS